MSILSARVRSAAGASALATVCLLALAPPAGAQAERPPLWSGQAGAAGLRLFLTTEPPAVPVPTLVDLRVPEGSSRWESSGVASARVSSVYPGAAGIGGIQLLCDFGAPCPEPAQEADYPFTAFAEHPGQPDAQTVSGFGKAHAGRDFVATTARPGNLVPLDAIGDVVRVGGASAVTRQEFLENGVLTVRATSSMTGVELGGGALTVGSIEVASVSRASAGGAPETEASVTIASVRTAQGGVVVDDDGVTVGGQGGGGEVVREVNDALATALESTSLSARLVGVTSSSEASRTTGQATGLLVSMAQPVSGPAVPGADRAYRTYLATLVLGDASTSAFASDAAFAVSTSGLADVGATGGTSGAAGQAASAPGASDGSAPSVGAPAGTTAAGPDPSGEVAEPAVAAPADDAEGQDAGLALLAGDALRVVTNGYAGVVVLAGLLFVLSRLGGRRIAGSQHG